MRPSPRAEGRVSLYKIVFRFKAFLWESMILSLLPSHLQTLPYHNTIASPLRNIRPPTDPPLYDTHHTRLVIAILCKGREGACS